MDWDFFISSLKSLIFRGEVVGDLLSIGLSKIFVLSEHARFSSGTQIPVPPNEVLIGDPCLDLLASIRSWALRIAKDNVSIQVSGMFTFVGPILDKDPLTLPLPLNKIKFWSPDTNDTSIDYTNMTFMVFLVITQTMAKVLIICPSTFEGQVVHWKGRLTGYFWPQFQKLWQSSL